MYWRKSLSFLICAIVVFLVVPERGLALPMDPVVYYAYDVNLNKIGVLAQVELDLYSEEDPYSGSEVILEDSGNFLYYYTITNLSDYYLGSFSFFMPADVPVVQVGTTSSMATVSADSTALSINISPLYDLGSSESTTFWVESPYAPDEVMSSFTTFNSVVGAPNPHNVSGPSVPVPEPTTLLLLGTGLIGLAGIWRIRQNKNGT